MRRLSLLIGAVYWVFSTGACPGQSASPLPHSLARPEKELKDFLLRYVNERGDDGSTTRYFEAFADLNGDGTKEAIIHLIGRWWCGTGGCPTLILAPDGPSYRVIAMVLATRAPIRVLQTSSHGWRSLAVWVQGGGIQPGHEAELDFDGQSYPNNPATKPAHRISAGSEGVLVLTSEANLFAKGKPLYP